MINGYYNPQASIDRINSQIAELEKMKSQLPQPPIQQAPITQNFQLAPTNREVIKYANSMEEVSKDIVIGDTPYFSKDMSVVWIKNTKGEIKTYELNEIVVRDEKDIQIQMLQEQINELKRGMMNNEHITSIDEPIEDEKPTSVSTISKSSKKSK